MAMSYGHAPFGRFEVRAIQIFAVVFFLAVAAFAAPKSASAYYSDAAFQYIENRLPSAEITCNEGLQYYPNDQKLQRLLDRIHEAKDEQKNENKKNDKNQDNNQDQNKDQNQDQNQQDQNNDQKQPPLSDKAKEVLARALQLCKDGKYAEAKEMLENLIAEDETAGQLSGHVQRIDDVIEIKAGRKPKAKIDASNTDNDLEVI